MKHSIWYLIPFLLAALYFVDSIYEKNLALKSQASSKTLEASPSHALPQPAEATLFTK